MKKVFGKLVKFVVSSAIVAGATKGGVMLLRKFNKDGNLEAKANDLIDSQAEKASTLAKAGVSKAIAVADEGSDAIEEVVEDEK